MPGDRTRARELAQQSIRNGDPTGWFETLYKEGEEGKSIVPWADRNQNPNLLAFWNSHPLPTEGKSALVVGCGFGNDAEQLARWGFETCAFDVSETAIRLARKRAPESHVDFRVANLFDPPAEWRSHFDFVFEANTVQALPRSVRTRAIERIAAFVKPGGNLLVIARAREENDPEGQIPWPLSRNEMAQFERFGLVEKSFEDFFDSEEPPSRRFRALYERT